MRFKKRWKVSLQGLMASLFVLLLSLYQVSAFAAVPVDTVIPVSCIGENTSEAFKVCLRLETEEFQKCDTKEISLKNGEQGSFHITYLYPGTYKYKIWQEKGTDTRTTYDDTVYTVHVYVTEDENGVMHTEPVIFVKGNDGKCDGAAFRNSRVIPSSMKTGIINTGDSTVIGQYIILIAGSAGALALLIFISKRRKGGEK